MQVVPDDQENSLGPNRHDAKFGTFLVLAFASWREYSNGGCGFAGRLTIIFNGPAAARI